MSDIVDTQHRTAVELNIAWHTVCSRGRRVGYGRGYIFREKSALSRVKLGL